MMIAGFAAAGLKSHSLTYHSSLQSLLDSLSGIPDSVGGDQSKRNETYTLGPVYDSAGARPSLYRMRLDPGMAQTCLLLGDTVYDLGCGHGPKDSPQRSTWTLAELHRLTGTPGKLLGVHAPEIRRLRLHNPETFLLPNVLYQKDCFTGRK